MRSTITSALSALAFTLTFSGAAAGQTADTSSPLNGTWKLDPAASRYNSGPAMRDEVRVYTINGNKVKLVATGTDGSGKPVKYSYSAAYDGKVYAMTGNPVADHITLTRVDPRTTQATVMKGKTVYAHAKLVVSPDGEHLAFTREVVRANASPAVDEIAYVKQH